VRKVARPRRYISRSQFRIMRPLLRHSVGRDAYVLRLVGNSYGPVLRVDRRARAAEFTGADRRRRTQTA
jgi:hypothetical protein